MKLTVILSLLAALIAPAGINAADKPTESATTKPVAKSAKPRMEVCFVLDTTGSMSGLIEGAKQKIWSIANEMMNAKPTPEIRFGLVGYRDRGDAYVTKVFNLTDDIDAIYGQLREFKAGGGGDTPESVNEALDDAVNKMSWSTDRNVLKIIFLVGDAPPHMDYKDGPKYPDVCKAAIKKDVLINTIQCGSIRETTPFWTEIAKLAEGSFAAIGQTGNMIVVETPMDKKLAELNREMGTTLIAWGSESQRRSVVAKQSLAESAAPAASADRLSYNLKSGKAVQGAGELLDALADGTVKLESVKKDELPPELRKLDEQELKAHVARQQKRRADLQSQILEVSKQRDAYLDTERKRLASAGKGDAFDEKVGETIRMQAAKKGISYGK
jgi:Mg-chelatase subunit ChlD